MYTKVVLNQNFNISFKPFVDLFSFLSVNEWLELDLEIG